MIELEVEVDLVRMGRGSRELEERRLIKPLGKEFRWVEHARLGEHDEQMYGLPGMIDVTVLNERLLFDI